MRDELLTKGEVMSSKSNSGKELYPVIHCVGLGFGGTGHALANARIAFGNGADGVFLIGHKVHSGDMTYIYNHVRKSFPNMWIGINFLDVSINQQTESLLHLVRECIELNALWVDNMPNRDDQKLDVAIFAGVAFKYINPNPDGDELARACQQALQYCDVATTSGDKTGQPPSLEKLAAIHKNLAGRIPLAVASGVDAGNVTEMKPYVNKFLVASSIIERRGPLGTHEYLVPEKVRELADLIHA
jgi:hypothetical protein